MIPSLLPDDLKTGILHLGLGAFHRAHQAAFTQDAIAASGGDWGIEAVSMRNPKLAEVLNAQGGQFTLIERGSDGPVLKQIGVIRRAHALPGNTAAVSARMADPTVHIVTITVTEKGYGANIGAQQLNRSDPAIAHDLDGGAATPQSLVGLICLGLSARRAAGRAGMTLMSCDNIPENGRLLEAITLEYAGHLDPDLADWIASECAFPNAMVDRITPAATDETFALAQGDPAAIETEPFRQWVIEDRFAGPRPDWDAAGALIVTDVRPFEDMKLRMLNGAHSFIAYSGQLLGHAAVRDVMQDAECAQTVRWHMESVMASLSPIDGFDYATYAQDLIARFANRAIDHRCAQIAMDGSQKMPQRIFEPALELLTAGKDFESCAFATAVWVKFLGGSNEKGARLMLNDPLSDALRAIAEPTETDTATKVRLLGGILGPVAVKLWQEPQWQTAVANNLMRIQKTGVRGALSQARNR